MRPPFAGHLRCKKGRIWGILVWGYATFPSLAMIPWPAVPIRHPWEVTGFTAQWDIGSKMAE